MSMKTMVTAGFALIMLAGSVGVALAADDVNQSGTHDPKVNVRQARQHGRIQQGVHSGELTKAEAHGLRQEQRAIRTEEKAYKADGKLTKAERKDLHQDQNQASRDIKEQKHDEQTRK
jgi:CRISPR/Cas system-associated endoribonuclease Cas2